MLYNLNQVSFSYSPGKPVLANISLEINEEDIILITGLNGSGKTTLCRILTGLISSYKGTIQFNNKDLKAYKSYEMADKVLYLKQEGNLNIVAATPSDDIQIRQTKFKVKDDDAMTRDREEALQSIDMLSQKNMPTWELSAGQVKRIGLAALKLLPTHYWILDEPFLGLDDVSIQTIAKWLSERREKKLGALIINHQGNVDDSVFHIHYHLENGKLIKV